MFLYSPTNTQAWKSYDSKDVCLNSELLFISKYRLNGKLRRVVRLLCISPY